MSLVRLVVSTMVTTPGQNAHAGVTRVVDQHLVPDPQHVRLELQHRRTLGPTSFRSVDMTLLDRSGEASSLLRGDSHVASCPNEASLPRCDDARLDRSAQGQDARSMLASTVATS